MPGPWAAPKNFLGQWHSSQVQPHRAQVLDGCRNGPGNLSVRVAYTW